MSLDVWIKGPPTTEKCFCAHCGHEHTREEREYYFSANITHNLNGMAEAAGIYDCTWRPEEVGIVKAQDLIGPLKAGIEKLKSEPEKFKAFEPKNGWGKYEDFVPWLERYLEACESYPDGEISASR